MLLTFGIATAQSNLDLTGKTFLMVDKIPNSNTELYFISKIQVVYIITNIINGKTYIDKCPGKATYSDNKISIKCFCDDKELYPEPFIDSFIYDSSSEKLTSKSYRSTAGVYIVWNLK